MIPDVQLFDVSQYELEKMNEVDWSKTKHNIGVFLTVYKRSRERVGLSSIPKISPQAQLNEIEIQSSKLSINKKDKEEFEYTQKCFRHGFYAITHPYSPDVTERRRKIFVYRYLQGQSISIVSERINYQKNIIVNESKMGIVQFSASLDMLSRKINKKT